MKVNNISNSNITPPYNPNPNNPTFGSKIKILRKMNMDNLYMYNDVMDVMHKCKVGGVISNEGVKIDSATDIVLEMLNKLKIKFINIDNK